ncbi:MAG: hypothetical protein PVH29_13235 [Candidatus Zixiibacteriota bacterium]|jgi:hypothetical protein
MRVGRFQSWIILSAAAAALLAGACSREVEWPGASPEDSSDVIYVVAEGEDGAAVRPVSAKGKAEAPALTVDPASEVAVSPDGRFLLYGYDNALHEYELATGADRVLASFPGGFAREKGTDETGVAKTFVWRCGCRFRDIRFGPEGRVAFLVEPTECAMADEDPVSPAGELMPRTAFVLDAGAYVVGDGEPEYLGPTRAIYGYPDEATLVLENRLTVARYEFAGGTVTPLLPPDSHELGWLPPAVVSGDSLIAACSRAVEKSDQEIAVDIYVVKLDGSGRTAEPLLTFVGNAPATRVAASPDGKYAAVECSPQVFGKPHIVAVDVAGGDYKTLVEGGRLLRFGRGSGGVFYVAGSGVKGDVYLAGLDGRARRLTETGDLLPSP